LRRICGGENQTLDSLRKKIREFFRMLVKRSEEAKRYPERLVPLEDL
jgi:hypothetical protein